MNRIVAGCCAVVFMCPFVGETAENTPAAVPPELSGNFASPDGASVEVYQSAPDEFLLNVDDPGVAQIELTVRGKQNASPVAMRAITQFGEAPLQLVGEGAELYGRTEVAGKSLEFLVDAQGHVRTSVDGQLVKDPATSTEIEAGLVAEDFAATWTAMRTMAITIAPDGVSVRGASTPGSTQRVDRAFSRIAALTDEQRNTMAQVDTERRVAVGQVKAFRKDLAK